MSFHKGILFRAYIITLENVFSFIKKQKKKSLFITQKDVKTQICIVIKVITHSYLENKKEEVSVQTRNSCIEKENFIYFSYKSD